MSVLALLTKVRGAEQRCRDAHQAAHVPKQFQAWLIFKCSNSCTAFSIFLVLCLKRREESMFCSALFRSCTQKGVSLSSPCYVSPCFVLSLSAWQDWTGVTVRFQLQRVFCATHGRRLPCFEKPSVLAFGISQNETRNFCS